MYELIHIVQAAHHQGKKIIVQQDYLPLRWMWATDCHQISNISCTFVGNKIVDHSDVVGATPTGASSSSTWYLASIDWAKTTARRVDKLTFWDLVPLILKIWRWVKWQSSWWYHNMEILSILLALCEGNPPVTGGFPSQKANNVEHWCFLWFEMWWCSCDITVMASWTAIAI